MKNLLWILVVFAIFRDGTVWRFDKATVWTRFGSEVTIGSGTNSLNDITRSYTIAMFDADIHEGLLCLANVNPLESGVKVSKEQIRKLTQN